MVVAGTAATALALSQGAALAHVRHHHVSYQHVYYEHHVYRHHRYVAAEAGYYGRESAAAVEDPYGGPTLITSRPVPDTPFNRERFGGPMSYGGRATPPVGN
jgi:hypothetical protein